MSSPQQQQQHRRRHQTKKRPSSPMITSSSSHRYMVVPLNVTSPPPRPEPVRLQQFLQYTCNHARSKPDMSQVRALEEYEAALERYKQGQERIDEHLNAQSAISVAASVLDDTNETEWASSFLDECYNREEEEAALTPSTANDLLLVVKYSTAQLEAMRHQRQLCAPSSWWGRPHPRHGNATWARCRVCGDQVEPTPRDSMMGVGFFECNKCPNHWCQRTGDRLTRHDGERYTVIDLPCTFRTQSMCTVCGTLSTPVLLGPDTMCNVWTLPYRDYHYKRSLYECHLSNKRRQLLAACSSSSSSALSSTPSSTPTPAVAVMASL